MWIGFGYVVGLRRCGFGLALDFAFGLGVLKTRGNEELSTSSESGSSFSINWSENTLRSKPILSFNVLRSGS